MKVKLLTLLALLLTAATQAFSADDKHVYTSYTATSGNGSSNDGQYYDKLVDNDKSTKWCVLNMQSNTFIEFQSEEPIIPVGYIMTTGEDTESYPERNPKNWKILAKKQQSDEWTTLADVTNNDEMPAANTTDKEFSITDNIGAYQYFRLEVSAAKSGNVFQLAEFQFVVKTTDIHAISFTANDSTITKEVRLPYTFIGEYADYGESGSGSELVEIIRQLYQISGGWCQPFSEPSVTGSGAITSGSIGYDKYITINKPFEGTDTVGVLYFLRWDNGNSIEAFYTINVSCESLGPCIVDSMTLPETLDTVYIGKTLTLAPTFVPAWASNELMCTTSDANVAIGGAGTVTGVNLGTASIVVTPVYGITSVTRTVVVVSALATDESGAYLISNKDDWETFVGEVKMNNFVGKTAKLVADITEPVTTRVTTQFLGTFDGNGHTLTVNMNQAPFSAVGNGGVIKNLKVNGTVNAASNYASGLIAGISGSVTVENCLINVAITNSTGYTGGIVGHCGSGNTITMRGCVFAGSIKAPNNEYCGGLVGWCNFGDKTKANTLNLTNCLFSGTYSGKKQFHPISIKKNDTKIGGTRKNCFYTAAPVSVDNTRIVEAGTRVYPISCGTNVTSISITSNPTATYDTSLLSIHSAGLTQGNKGFAYNGQKLPLALTCADKTGYAFSKYTVAGGGSLADGNTATPTLTMTNANQTINVVYTPIVYTITYDLVGGTADNPTTYTIESEDITLTAPTKDGTSFLGWRGTDVEGITPDVTIAKGSYGDREFTAEWMKLILTDGAAYELVVETVRDEVTYLKTLDDSRVGKYQAWLVPFDYTVKEADLEKFKFWKVNMIANAPNTKTDATDELWVFLKKLEAGDVLRANMPYVYKPLEAVSDYEFTSTDATLKPRNAGVLAKTETLEDIYSFYATYENTTATDGAPFYYVAIDGTVCYGDNVTVGPYRWIIRSESKYGDTPAAYARTMYFSDDEGDETMGVSGIAAAADSDRQWYDMSGRRLAGKPAKSGIYVIDGQKVIIK